MGLLVAWASQAGWLEPAELQALDHLLAVRKPPPVDNRIRLVELDEATFDTIGLPQVLWRRAYAEVTAALLQSGARAVLLDSLFPHSWSRLPPEAPLTRELEAADLELAQVMLSGPVVLIDYDRGSERGPSSSEVLYFSAQSRQNLAVANLLTDPDGVVRRLPVYADEQGQVRFAAGRLAALAEGHPFTATADRLQGLPLEQGSLRVNFPGPGGLTFPSLSFARLLRQARAGQPIVGVRDKVVLIGPAALEFQDLVSTPLDRLRGRHTTGVEVHAAGLNTLLTRTPLERPGAPLLIFVLALAGGLWAGLAPFRTAALGLVLSLLIFLCLAVAALGSGRVLPVVAGGLSLTSGWLAGLVWRQATLERSRRQLQRLFGRFVSPQVMRSLLARPGNLAMGGHRARITVLFCDINNFTPTCEGHSPEEVITMLNRFFEAMLEVIFRFGGTVKQFAGDEIMVLYGAPDPVEDHAARAVQTALAMVARLDELRAQSSGPGFYEVKIGIHSGDVVVGNVGSEKRSEYAAVGDSVNLAARIEGLSKSLGATIVVSDVTYREASLDALPWRSLGVHHFKGKEQEMELWEVGRA